MPKRPVYLVDPTVADQASRNRGIGRYLSLLQHYLADDLTVVPSVQEVPFQSILLDPHFHLLGNPRDQMRHAHTQIGVIHDLIPQKHRSHFPIGIRGFITEYMNRWNLRFYDHWIAVSEKVKHDCIEELSISDDFVSTIYSTWDDRIDITAKSSKRAADDRHLVYVGDITWNKNLSTIARAVARGNQRCRFIGKPFAMTSLADVPDHPWYDDYRRFLEIADQSPLIELVGYVSDEQLQIEYQQAWANLLLSHDEGFGFSFLEAARNGTPSILSDIAIFREVAGDSAVFVDHRDPEKISQTIMTFTQNDSHRTQLQKRLPTQLSRYTPERFIQGYQQVFAKLQDSQ